MATTREEVGGNYGPHRWRASSVSNGHEDENNLLDNMNLPA